MKDGLEIKFTENDRGNPPGKLADAEIRFTAGPLDGLKLIGFGLWTRRNGSGITVTYPARQYSVNGERRSFALLRPVVDAAAVDRLSDLIRDAWTARQDEQARQTYEDQIPPTPAERTPADLDFAARPRVIDIPAGTF